jgi:hypothetical protein
MHFIKNSMKQHFTAFLLTSNQQVGGSSPPGIAIFFSLKALCLSQLQLLLAITVFADPMVSN